MLPRRKKCHGPLIAVAVVCGVIFWPYGEVIGSAPGRAVSHCNVLMQKRRREGEQSDKVNAFLHLCNRRGCLSV